MYTGGHALKSATCWVILKVKVAAYRKLLGRFITFPSSCLTTCTLKGSSASCSIAGGIIQVWQADQQVSPNILCFQVGHLVPEYSVTGISMIKWLSNNIQRTCPAAMPAVSPTTHLPHLIIISQWAAGEEKTNIYLGQQSLSGFHSVSQTQCLPAPCSFKADRSESVLNKAHFPALHCSGRVFNTLFP